MTHGVKKRKCRRFEIPGAEGKYRNTGLIAVIKGFSNACSVINISKGGLAFECEEDFHRGRKIKFQLFAPEEDTLDLRAIVLRQGHRGGYGVTSVAVKFLPFDNRQGFNSPDALDVLRRLDARYGRDR